MRRQNPDGRRRRITKYNVIDPEAIQSETEGGVPETAEDLKYTRTKELMLEGQFYLENGKYNKAQEYFEQILLIDPGNKTATRLLAEATVGAYKEEIRDDWQQLEIDRQRIRTGIEKSKLLPEGADDKGIKEPQISVPVEEEEYAVEREKTDVEMALDSPVSIEFDDEHITRITEFIAEYVGINIVVDARVVLPPRQAAPATTGVPGQPTPFPGALPPGAGTGAPGGLPPGALPTPGAPGLPPGGIGTINQAQGLQVQPQTTATGEEVTDGYVPYIKLEDVPLSDALKALLRPLNLSYSVQPGFLWISTAEKIRTESFEELETRIYELRNAGAETLFKIVIRNPGGQGASNFGIGGGGGGNFGGGGGNFGGGNFGGGGGNFGGGG
ncbi:MAG: tetratricopeptide repeat protein, partial [Bryobacteraceae bacterium]|nr:tetratricopeptide repeat protein [Bryobacteraceae bacterium]